MNVNKHIIIAFIVCLVGCKSNVSTNPDEDKLDIAFRGLLQESIDNSFNQIPGVTMCIVSDNPVLNWEGAVGYNSSEKQDTLEVTAPFRIASVTKTFVAASILRLHELDSLSIFDPISKYISNDHLEIIREGGYDPDLIKIIHCLNHTPGFFDYAMGGQTYIEMTKKNRNRRWTRTEQLKGAMEWGSKVGEPGEKYSYNDTGYILLGEIIENFSNGLLAGGIRNLLKFKINGIDHTWLETMESHPDSAKKVVHRYFRRENYTEWDPSIDLYGGGGIISITTDLARFMHLLFNNEVFDKHETLDLMLRKADYADTYIPEDNPRHNDYRQGLWRKPLYGDEVFLHSGLWGTHMLHVPKYNTSISINYTKGNGERLIKKAYLIVKNILEESR